MAVKNGTVIETFRGAIFDSINEPLLVLDSELSVLTANESFYDQFKVVTEETVGKCVFDIGNGQWNIPDLRRLLEKMLPEKSIVKDFEVIHEFPTLGKRVMLLNASDIHSNEFIPLDLILIVFQDVTDKKNWTNSILELNKKLEDSNMELERFGHALSHDLRGPLSAMVVLSELILNDYGSELSENMKESMIRLDQSAKTMNDMISGLSELAGLSHLSIIRTTVNLSEIADKVIMQLRMGQPNRSVDVIIQHDIIENVEPSMLLIVLTNLLKNSWKFTRDSSPAKIVFGVKEMNGRKTYFVNDNGIGFDVKSSKNLFNMFQRLPSGKTFEGTGTGLAIAKSIIKKHSGDIWAESEEGKWTTIYFTINP
ncbi:MAG: PAS domain-containing protein [Fibrobacteres bacterium]|nr:PAS domain-containing protein [Fibrobacterota bacterium]